jgi:tRNA G18 (ribose-2'-O)-methylase SpoU
MTHPKFPTKAARVPPDRERVMDRTTSGPSEAHRRFRQTPTDALTPLRANVPQPAAGYEGLRLPAAVLLDNVRSMYNVGAFFRAADGVGLEKICLCGITAHPPKKAISKTALGAEEVVDWQPRFPVCVAFGNEVEGLRPELLEIADTHVRIPMLGKKTSLNVATAAGIVFYELLRKFRILSVNAERGK